MTAEGSRRVHGIEYSWQFVDGDIHTLKVYFRSHSGYRYLAMRAFVAELLSEILEEDRDTYTHVIFDHGSGIRFQDWADGLRVELLNSTAAEHIGRVEIHMGIYILVEIKPTVGLGSL